MYPVMLNVFDRLCTVVGGGKVALHKAEKLAESGARVRVVSMSFIDGFETFETLRKKYAPSDIEGSFLVIAAADDMDLNKKIADDARGRNILTAVADNAAYSDFISPASVTSGDITLSVSTNGKFPMLAKKLCLEKSEELDFFSGILPLLSECRRRVIEMNRTDKSELLEFMLSDEMLGYAVGDRKLFEKKLDLSD